MERCRLNGTNYIDWDRNLRLVLMQERKEYVLDRAIPVEPAANAQRSARDVFNKHTSDCLDVGVIMLGCMEMDLQKQFMELSKDPFTMMNQIKEMFKEKARVERYVALKELMACKMQAGSSVGPHVLKMKGHLEHLARIDVEIKKEMAADMVLQSLPRAF